MRNLHLTPAEVGTIRTALDKIERVTLVPGADVMLTERLVLEAVESVRLVLSLAEERTQVQ